MSALVTFSYDNLRRRTSMSGSNGTATSFQHDAASRLTSLSHDLNDPASDVTSAFTYTPASQLRTWTRNNDAYAWTSHYNVNRSYVADGLNRVTQSDSGSTPLTFGYDARGNLTNYGPAVYGYTAENRLSTASSGATFHYDPLGRLSQSSGMGTTSRFQYDGHALVTEWNSSGQIVRRYVHGPGVDEPLIWYEGNSASSRRWFHRDERGSVVAISDSAGQRVAINSYDEFGTPAGGNLGRFQYTGQVWLPELGVYCYKARMYAPALGRFMQTDPIGYEDDVNLYAYSRNDPVNRVDPLGDASVVVARLLSSPVGYLGVGHAFVATNARYLGDPDATIYSFGPLENGNMGNISDPTRSAPGARGTFADDRQAWLRLGYRNVTANVSQIDAPDEVVDAVAKAVAENKPYSYVPSDAEAKFTRAGEIQISETNSNSAAFAVGDKAERIASGDPNAKVDRKPFNMALPGIGAAGKVDFKSKVTCTGSRIARESC